MRRSSLLQALFLVLAPCLAHAKLDHRLSLLGGGELRLHPERGGHGVVLIGYDLTGLLPRQGVLSAEFNTDTVRVRLARLRFWGERLHLSFRGAYEFLMAGLLMDYYRDGVIDPSRGFDASYLELGTSIKLQHPGNHSFELDLGLRRWFVSARQETAADLVLPAESWVLEPRLRYTYWRLHGERAWSERHRLFPRVRGIAVGLTLGLDWRSKVGSWGARSADFSPKDLRNDPDQTAFTAQAWLLAGSQLHDRLRTQIRQLATLGLGLDDLNRVRVGGLNPYVVQVAGAPWAAFLAERAIATRWSWHLRLFRELEAGVLADLAWIDDLHRTGTSLGGVLLGLGVFADLRWGNFQLDLHAGMAPRLEDTHPTTQLAFLALLGWMLDSAKQ